MPDLFSTPTTPLFSRMQQQVHPSAEESRRVPLTKALALLPERSADTMPNVTLVPPTKHLPGVVQQHEAHTTANDPNIYVNEDSRMYQDAHKGQREALIKLASALTHERHHIEHGPAEAGAYDQQLAILKALGASPKTIASVDKSKQFVVQSGK